jgi:hypothetical protein
VAGFWIYRQTWGKSYPGDILIGPSRHLFCSAKRFSGFSPSPSQECRISARKCRVPLLPRRLPVAFQHLVDSLIQFRLFPLMLLSLSRDRTSDRLAHHAPVRSMLLRQPFDRLSGRIGEPTFPVSDLPLVEVKP